MPACAPAPLVAVLYADSACKGVLIESAVVKDNVSRAGFVMGVVETLLSSWLH